MDVTDTYIEQVRPDPTSPSGLSTVYQGALEHIVPIPETFRLNAACPGRDRHGRPGAARRRACRQQTLIVPRRNNGPIVVARRDRRHRAVGAVRRLLGDPRARHVPPLRPGERPRRLPRGADLLRRRLAELGLRRRARQHRLLHQRRDAAARRPRRPARCDGLPPCFLRDGTGGNEWVAAERSAAGPGAALRDPAAGGDAAHGQPAQRASSSTPTTIRPARRSTTTRSTRRARRAASTTSTSATTASAAGGSPTWSATRSATGAG